MVAPHAEEHMVKLERHGGSSLFIRPESVRSISASGVEGCSTVWLATESYVVKGDPDEVHAALFPPVSAAAVGLIEEANQAAANVQKVLQWVALDSRDAPAFIRDLARMYVLRK